MQLVNRTQGAGPIEAVLGKLALCEGIEAHTLRLLALHARIVRAPRGEVIVRRGERPAGVYGLVYGAVKVRLQPAEDDEVILALLGPGATFGKAATLLALPSRADAVALEESLLVSIGAAALSAQMARDARLVRNLASALAANTHALLGEFEHSRRPTLQRLAAYLDSIAEPTPSPDVWAARLPVSKTVVAARLGMKKETLSRLLQRLAKCGLIHVAQRDITILDRPGLSRLVQVERVALEGRERHVAQDVLVGGL